MPRLIFCEKLKKKAEGFDYLPYPGELGKKIYLKISKEAWALWQARQTMLINEYRLNLSESTAQKFLAQELENFLFAASSEYKAAPLNSTDIKTSS